MQDSSQFDVELEDEEEGVIGDDEATQDTVVDPMQVCCLLCDSRHAVHCDREGVGWGLTVIVPPALCNLVLGFFTSQHCRAGHIVTTSACMAAVLCAGYLQAPNAATANDDEEYVVGDAHSSEDMLDDSDDIISDLPAIRGNGAAVQQQAAVAAASHSSVSNADAGADVAMQILGICKALGGSATAADYEQILQVCYV